MCSVLGVSLQITNWKDLKKTVGFWSSWVSQMTMCFFPQQGLWPKNTFNRSAGPKMAYALHLPSRSIVKCNLFLDGFGGCDGKPHTHIATQTYIALLLVLRSTVVQGLLKWSMQCERWMVCILIQNIFWFKINGCTFLKQKHIGIYWISCLV